MNRLLAPMLLVLAAPGLSGCAALAVPVATGLLLGTRVTDDRLDSRTDRPRPEPTEVAQAARGAGEAAADAGEKEAGEAAAPVPIDPATQDRIAGLTAGKVVGVAPFSEPPPPSGASEDAGAYAALFAKVTAIAQADPAIDPGATGERQSAFLADPVALQPERVPCAFAQTAVLVDLDPGEGEAPLDEAAMASTQLSRVLAALRAQEVAVLWLSRHTAARAGAVRRALLRSGLDPGGEDELYLVRYEDETKDTRRADAAKDYCVVAILGDEKRDFDELFAFLKDPQAAFALDPLIGEAWFLAPPPLTASPVSESSSPPATPSEQG